MQSPIEILTINLTDGESGHIAFIISNKRKKDLIPFPIIGETIQVYDEGLEKNDLFNIYKFKTH